MKIIKKLLTLCLLVVMMFLAVHTPISEDAVSPHNSEVIIKHNANNQDIVHNQKPDHAVTDKVPVFQIPQPCAAAEIVHHFFTGRTVQREGTLFKQRARSTIVNTMIHIGQISKNKPHWRYLNGLQRKNHIVIGKNKIRKHTETCVQIIGISLFKRKMKERAEDLVPRLFLLELVIFQFG